MNGKAHDTRIDYPPAEADILFQAETILRRRLERLGKITDPTQASEFLRMRLGGLEHEEFHVVFLDARHAISVTERQRYILRVRTLAREVAHAYYASREAAGFPMAPEALRRELLQEPSETTQGDA